MGERRRTLAVLELKDRQVTGHCRSCSAPLGPIVADLGAQPPANALAATAEDALARQRHPLVARLCERCLLVQLEHTIDPEQLFADYPFLSSMSATWRAHVERFAVDAIERFGLGPSSLVIEIASNDGCLLQPLSRHGVPVLGIEPVPEIAELARSSGIDTRAEFFDIDVATRLRDEGIRPDLVIANNVWAHVPDLPGFTEGLAVLAGDDGVVSIEVPHLLRMIERGTFDTIYHEHCSYFSVLAAEDVLARAELALVDVEEIPTHGGSLRCTAARAGRAQVSERVAELRAAEHVAGLDGADGYRSFPTKVAQTIASFRELLGRRRDAGGVVAGYGAAAKATVLLNAAGATSDDLPFVADVSPHKIGRYIPGCGIPIVSPQALVDRSPDTVVVFAWNLLDEVRADLGPRLPNTEFVASIPEPTTSG